MQLRKLIREWHWIVIVFAFLFLGIHIVIWIWGPKTGAFLWGFFIGGMIGVIAMALCAVASDADRHIEIRHDPFDSEAASSIAKALEDEEVSRAAI